jgi:hypothetical protein
MHVVVLCIVLRDNGNGKGWASWKEGKHLPDNTAVPRLSVTTHVIMAS